MYQPWASLVACGAKRLETRSWSTRYRGPLLIHAGLQKPPRSHYSAGLDKTPIGIDSRTVEEMIQALGVGDFDTLPRGAVVAVADLTRCDQVTSDHTLCEAMFRAHGYAIGSARREYVFGDYTPNRWMWLLWDVKPLPTPIDWPGQRGLWTPPDELTEQVRDALPAWPA